MNMASTVIIVHVAMGLKPVAMEKATGKLKAISLLTMIYEPSTMNYKTIN
jgi:hypothetical protein